MLTRSRTLPSRLLLRAWRGARTAACPKQCFSTCGTRRDPLRILFCGAGEFSSHSLRALHELKEQRPDTVSSIEVVCRTDKRTGRGLKHIRQVPIKPVAESLNLRIHQIDAFTAWTPPTPVDLVVAVSFGLLFPARILQAARYGGLNVHPSLLPDLRGASPLQYALMLGRKQTGVSLQTMHPTKFDHGVILARESVPVPDDCSLEHLSETLGRLGAILLRNAIEKGTFAHPQPLPNAGSNLETGELAHAPKITKEDARIDWRTWPADKVIRYGRVLELWDETVHEVCLGKTARVKYHGPWMSVPDHHSAYALRSGPVEVVGVRIEGQKSPRLAVRAADGTLVSPTSASIEAKRKHGGIQALLQSLKQHRATIYR